MESKLQPNYNLAPGKRRATCSNCRRRKSKCDSRQPQCSTCLAHKTQCHYEKPPSLAYVRTLEAKIEQLMNEKRSNPARSLADSEHPNQEQRPLDNVLPDSNSAFQTQSHEDEGSSRSPENEVESKGEPHSWVSEISVDSRGDVCYHNPTSAIHEALSVEERSGENLFSKSSFGSTLAIENGSIQQTNDIKNALVSNAAAQKRMETMAVETMVALRKEVSSEMASEFLNLHWCWIHPTFMFVYRPAFTRGMALTHPSQTDASYFSDTLLKVLFAHTSRFLANMGQTNSPATTFMNTLTEQARVSLAMRTLSPSSIPTIQALLQQSAREVAFGKSSQAWLYSGMAFRMAIDLGIQLPSDRLQDYIKTLTVEDIEIRKRLFWSCYTWDKAISVYLGRMPAFTPPMVSNIPNFMDDFSENELWEPYYGSESSPDSEFHPPYPPTKGYMISSFTNLCKLSVILSTVMLEIYSPSPVAKNPTRPQNPKTRAFHEIRFQLQKWWEELPEHLRIDLENLPRLSPPLHIVSLNLLYHTTMILLHRPFIIGAVKLDDPAVSRSFQICVSAACGIRDLLDLLTKTFGHGHLSYLNCYCAYIAATIAVFYFEIQECQPGVYDALSERLGLESFMATLQRAAARMPGLHRSVEIVKRHMQIIVDKRAKKYLASLFPVADPSMTRNSEAPRGTVTNERMPSVPLFDPNWTPRPIPNDTGVQESPAYGHSQLYSSFNLEGLPAFPGQDFNMGSEYTLDQDITDPAMRATLLGLDPHLTLHHGDFDWGYQTGNGMQ